MHRSIEQSLALRMGLSLSLLLIATGGFIGMIWGVFVAILLLARVSLSTAMILSTVPALIVLLWIIIVEYRDGVTIEQGATATPVTAKERPPLHATVNRVSSILNVPTPTIAISDSQVPEAMVVGVRPTNSRLILSEGTLEALNEDELEAVIAHELAHVKNYDASVMTVISVPVALADGLVARARELARHRGDLAIVLGAVGLVGVAVTQAITSVCSRTRELAADQAAVEVLGSGAPLASALLTLDQRIKQAPSQDLRDVHAVSSLSILPFERYDRDLPSGYWEEVNVNPFLGFVRKPVSQYTSWVFRTHPTTEKRLQLLSELEE
ncbi:M48 family metallopeptidase [Halostagnicola kamekurae]|uniref:Heat shock protein. Metallo peptidase. MEROPS family M48B n=1 Tax=Halostagnicola kamekurae TaxID=619731 RepID=A0A1I6U4E2_9EURY|nr:M48 family metalloprotease [Halostagnicola kamekurae]SFS96292.1 Heat shock protein. Metallo peptidase. MEROPS family M48B [Halostagnicola kamekurae]